ncbi:MAG: Eco57I restriction-modification methylase domain-containing protein, partial [Methanomicrobium sp.]|nr:Eco57I restriction-modification methylase domain-containing protein [Methanomicrobium sp.]
MPAPIEIIELVERFNQYNSKYTSPSYNETQVRREFIDPFFKALGWDVDNNRGYDERYKEVIHEDAIKIGGKTKAPDYSFRIGGVRKFFVEAKKPAVNLKENPEPAYQLRRYAWSAKLPVSILTDFEEFIVFDCTKKPSPKDPSSKGRIVYYTYNDYIEKWDEIENLFSKQQIPKGALDDLGESLIKKKGGKGTAGIDEAFLAEIEGWRDVLARNIALRNKELSVRELNLAVQKIIDRIIFLRICEDRGIEEYGQLKAYGEGKDIYKNLIKLFLHADDKYNSGLFHFKKEEGKDEPDILTNTLDIDDKILKPILNNLYYPDSPYEFSVLPADILGQVYEQFLGKVIRLTDSHQAKIEEKPEVKKAGGVFYTPTYIVDYIVKNTVGKLVVGKTPKEVSELKIVDPACGSGSFLIGAYQYLLDWHVSWYMDNLAPLLREGKSATDKEILELLPVKPKSKQKGRGRKKSSGSEHDFPIYQMSENDWRLTSDEKKRILINNIHGVDIDQQAVEVTKLSLLLKVLEGEKSERITKQLTITQERVLPSLHNNIKCGNSLIGPDIYSDIQTTFDDDEEYYRINAFDWKREFSDIFKNGGFDAVIGNPPYVRQEILGAEFKNYAKAHYTVYHGIGDLYTYFIEKGVSLLNSNGQFSYIVANKWLRANYGKPLREWMFNQRIEEIVDFGDLPIFKTATTYPCILRISKGKPADTFDVVDVENLDFRDLSEYVAENKYPVRQSSLDVSGWSLVDETTQALLNKLNKTGIPLGEYVEGKIFYGIKTGLNKAFVIDEETKNRLISEDPKSAEIIKPFLEGKDIKRYTNLKPLKFLILFKKGWTNENSAG